VFRYYDNFLNDYLKKLFAVSLLKDNDFPDFPEQSTVDNSPKSDMEPKTPITNRIAN